MNNFPVRFYGALTVVFSALALAAFVGTVAMAAPAGAPFLTVDPFPRRAAMGDAGAALAGDASALFLNPGGLAFAEKKEIQASHTQLFQDSAFDSVHYLYPFGSSAGASRALGLGAVYLSRGSIESRDENRNLSGSYHASDLAAQVSFGQKMSPRLSAGVSAKFVQQRIADATATGAAIDAGLRARNVLGGLSVGAALTNAGTSMKFLSESYSLPTSLRLGLGYEVSRLTFAADDAIPLHGGGGKISLGGEYAAGLLRLRAGYVANTGAGARDSGLDSTPLSQFAGLSAGLGVKLGDYGLDYALVPHEALGPTQQISFSARFQ